MPNAQGFSEFFDVTAIRGFPKEKNLPAILAADVKVLKVALLYGNHVSFVSPNCRLWDTFGVFDDASKVNIIHKRALIKFYLDKFDHGRGAEGLSPLREIMEDEDLLNLMWPRLAKPFIERVMPELPAIEKLRASGRLSFYDSTDASTAPAGWAPGLAEITDIPFPGSITPAERQNVIEQIRSTFERRINNIYRWVDYAISASETFPFLDVESGIIAEDIAALPSSRGSTGMVRSKALPVAGRLFAKLEDFERATVDEVIDIRKDLDESVRRFQNAVAELSISFLEVPDGDLGKEIEKAWISDILPQLSEIDENIKGNKYLRQLVSNSMKDPKAALAPIFGLSVATMLHDPAGYGMGALIGSAPLFLQGAGQKFSSGREIRRHKFYFLYSAGRRLAKRKAR